MRPLKKYLSSKNRAQTILELMAVAATTLFFFGFVYYFLTVFEVAQKQTALLRTQAFIELGNYSYYGGQAHGEDDVTSEQSHVIFSLGQSQEELRGSAITGVDLNDLPSFKEAVEGELELIGWRSADEDEMWLRYNFPKAVTEIRAELKWPGQAEPSELNVTLFQVFQIAHNRSLNILDEEFLADGQQEFITGTLGFEDWVASWTSQVPNQAGLVDNLDVLEAQLAQVVQADTSLATRADNLINGIGPEDYLLGSGLLAAGISNAITLGISVATSLASSAISSAAAESASTAGDVGGGAASGAAQAGNGVNVNLPGIFRGTFEQGQVFHNLGEGLLLSSQILNTVNLGFALAGERVEGLEIATVVTGGAGSLFKGVHQLGNFFEGDSGQLLVRPADPKLSPDGAQVLNFDIIDAPTRYSDFFGGTSTILGGASSVVGYFDPEVGRVLATASAISGLGGTIAGINENISKDFVSARWNPEAGQTTLNDGSVVTGSFERVTTWGQYDAAGNFEFRDGHQWSLTQSIGQGVGQVGNIVAGVVPDSDVGAAIAIAGQGIQTIGTGGKLFYDLNNEGYLVEVVKNGEVQYVTKDDGFGNPYAELDGNGKPIVLKRFDHFGFTQDLGSLVANVSGVGSGVATLTGDEDAQRIFGYGATLGGAVAAVGATGSLVEDIYYNNVSGWEKLATTGVAISTGAGVGATAAQLAGQEKLAEAFAYGSLAGVGVAAVGGLGLMGQEIAGMVGRMQDRSKLKELLRDGDVSLAEARGSDWMRSDFQGPLTEEQQFVRSLAENGVVNLRDDKWARYTPEYKQFEAAVKAGDVDIFEARNAEWMSSSYRGDLTENQQLVRDLQTQGYIDVNDTDWHRVVPKTDENRAQIQAYNDAERAKAQAQEQRYGEVQARVADQLDTMRARDYASTVPAGVNSSREFSEAIDPASLSRADALRYQADLEVLQAEERLVDLQEKQRFDRINRSVGTLMRVNSTLQQTLPSIAGLSGGGDSEAVASANAAYSAGQQQSFNLGSVNSSAQSLALDSIANQLPADKAAELTESFQIARDSLNLVNNQISNNQFPDVAAVARGSAASERALALSEEARGLPPRGSEARAEYDRRAYTRNLRGIADANDSNVRESIALGNATALTIQAEEQVSNRRIMVSNSQRTTLQRQGRANAAEIREVRERYFDEDDYMYQRMLAAERAWEDVSIISPEETMAFMESTLEQARQIRIERESQQQGLRVGLAQ